MIALLPMLLAASEPPREASSLEHIGEVVANARVCHVFGYTVDPKGLSGWAATSRDAVVRRDPSLTWQKAQRDIERHVVSSFKRSFAMYWDAGTRPGRPADEFIETEYRFVKRQRKVCERLAGSGEVGRFLTPPAQEPASSEIIARVREEFRRFERQE